MAAVIQVLFKSAIKLLKNDDNLLRQHRNTGRFGGFILVLQTATASTDLLRGETGPGSGRI